MTTFIPYSFSVYSDENAIPIVPSKSSSYRKSGLTAPSAKGQIVATSNKHIKGTTAPLRSKSHAQSTLRSSQPEKSSLKQNQEHQPYESKYKSEAEEGNYFRASQPQKLLQSTSSKATFTVFSDDKENIDPLGRRKIPQTNRHKSEQGSNVDKKSCYIAPAIDLWKGKQPFDLASPEKGEGIARGKAGGQSTRTSSSKYIYDLPGVPASRGYTLSGSSIPGPSLETSEQPVTASATSASSFPGSRSSQGGVPLAISRPNKKKNRPVPAPLKKASTFEVFKEPLPPGRLRADPGSAGIEMEVPIIYSPVVSVADRRAKQLTESPLADVTQAYTGRGGFNHSPLADSGFGSRETSVSPLHSARSLLSFSDNNADIMHNASSSSENCLVEADAAVLQDLPKGLERLCLSDTANHFNSPTGKRRISNVSIISTSSVDQTLQAQLVNTNSSASSDNVVATTRDLHSTTHIINQDDKLKRPRIPFAASNSKEKRAIFTDSQSQTAHSTCATLTHTSMSSQECPDVTNTRTIPRKPMNMRF